MKILTVRWVALALVVLSCPSVFSEETTLPKEAQDLLAKAALLTSYQATFSLEAREEAGEPVRLKGKLSYKKPHKRRLELKEAGSEELSQLLVSDGKVEWQYYPLGKVAYRMDSPQEPPGPHRPFSEIQAGTLKFVQRVGSPGEAQLRFTAVPLPSMIEGSPVPIRSLRVDVGEADGLVRELSLLDETEEPVLTQRYQDIQVNVELPEESFTFLPPEGVEVIELSPPMETELITR